MVVKRQGKIKVNAIRPEMDQALHRRVLQVSWYGRSNPGAPQLDWEVRLTSGKGVHIPRSGGAFSVLRDEEDLWVSEDEHNLQVWRPGFGLLLNLLSQTGEAQIAAPRYWQNVLRLIYFFGLLECGGLLLHAASIVHQGRAFLFPGPTGAGKTTIVRHSPGKPILSDEISAVHLPRENLPVTAHGTPFFGDWGQPGEKLSVPLSGIYFPVKNEANRVVPLSHQETLVRLLPCVCTFTTWEPRLKKLLDLTIQLARRVPGYLLYFRPDPAFWETIDAA